MGGDRLQPRPAPDGLLERTGAEASATAGRRGMPPMNVVVEDGIARNADANGRPLPTGDEFAVQIMELSGWEREKAVLEQIEAGNIPAFLRDLKPVTVEWTENGATHSATYYVMPDYVAIGTDDNFVRIPMSTATAQVVADKYGMSLPTATMVDQIYAQATVRLPAQTRDYYDEGKGLSKDAPALREAYTFEWSGDGKAQTSTAAYHEESRAIDAQLQGLVDQNNQTPWAGRKDHLHGELIAGHGKDLVITPNANPDAIQFYGWYDAHGNPIQSEAGRGNPVNGHKGDPNYVDYSHKVRLVGGEVEVDGRSVPIGEALKDPAVARHLSSEGAFSDAHPPRVPEKNVREAGKHGVE